MRRVRSALAVAGVDEFESVRPDPRSQCRLMRGRVSGAPTKRTPIGDRFKRPNNAPVIE